MWPQTLVTSLFGARFCSIYSYMVGLPEDELWLSVAPLGSLAGLFHVFGGSHLVSPCLQQLDLQCDSVVIAIIVYNIGRGDLPHQTSSWTEPHILIRLALLCHTWVLGGPRWPLFCSLLPLLFELGRAAVKRVLAWWLW